MKTQKKRMTATIAILLTLTLAATFITGLPFTFGLEAPKISMNWSREIWVVPAPAGVNQEVLIQQVLTPRPPGYNQDPALSKHNIYEDILFTIERPDGTTENVTMDTNDRSEMSFWYNCTQVGVYRIRSYWAGDETHSSTTSPWRYWLVQEEPVAPPGKVSMWARLDVVSPVIGRGQLQYIIGWLTPPHNCYRFLYHELEFTVTKPSGNTITKIMDTDTPNTASFGVVCDETGEWSVEFSYDGDLLHESAVSDTITWIVQEEEVPATPQQPLPTYPWKWPVSAEYWEWYQITGPWKGSQGGTVEGSWQCSFNPYTKAPNTPHILWKKQMDTAGIMGGETGYMSWIGSTVVPVAAQGRLYYNRAQRYTLDGEDRGTHPVLYCLDQYTGELIYRRDLPGTGSGGSPYLVMEQRFKTDPQMVVREISMFSLFLTSGGVWQVDPWTGNTEYYNPDLSGTLYEDAIYANNYPEEGNLTKWDINTRSIVWTTQAPIENIEWTRRFPNRFGEGLAFVMGVTAIRGQQDTTRPYRLFVWNLTTGEMIHNGTAVPEMVYSCQTNNYIVQDHKVFHLCADLRTRAVDIVTGKVVWTSEPTDAPWGAFGIYHEACSWGPSGGGDMQMYMATFDGHIYCYDTATGHINWRAFTVNTTETAMGHHTPWSEIVTADNKVYFSVGEHTPPQPYPRDGQLYCVDAVTGERIWTFDGFYGRATSQCGVSGGMLWYPNAYDGCLYMFGKGETATTVDATPAVISKGDSVLIKGTVTDQSPGAKDTPAVSDASQDAWMGYLYMDKPMPTDCEGVEVVLQGVRSDGTVFDIGRTTSGIMGHYEYLWTPPDEDTYKILATFEGSESYWTSSAQTALGVTEAPSPGTPIPPTTEPPTTPPPTTEPPTTPPPTTEPPTTPPPTSEPPTEAPIITTEVTIAVAVAVAAVIGIGAYWALRRRK
jgi:outer membrane protein assembly factor BamB